MMLNDEQLLKIAEQYLAVEEKAKPDPNFEARVQFDIKHMAGRGYILDHSTIEAIKKYEQGYSLLLTGNVGVGKTHFFKCLPYDIYALDMNFAMRWKFNEIESWLECHVNDEVLIDDIGAGSSKGNDYGVQYDVLMCLLNGRMRSRKRTHFTTNCNSVQLINSFDYRAVDRIYGMAFPIKMDRVESLRQPKPFK